MPNFMKDLPNPPNSENGFFADTVIQIIPIDPNDFAQAIYEIPLLEDASTAAIDDNDELSGLNESEWFNMFDAVEHSATYPSDLNANLPDDANFFEYARALGLSTEKARPFQILLQNYSEFMNYLLQEFTLAQVYKVFLKGSESHLHLLMFFISNQSSCRQFDKDKLIQRLSHEGHWHDEKGTILRYINEFPLSKFVDFEFDLFDIVDVLMSSKGAQRLQRLCCLERDHKTFLKLLEIEGESLATILSYGEVTNLRTLLLKGPILLKHCYKLADIKDLALKKDGTEKISLLTRAEKLVKIFHFTPKELIELSKSDACSVDNLKILLAQSRQWQKLGHTTPIAPEMRQKIIEFIQKNKNITQWLDELQPFQSLAANQVVLKRDREDDKRTEPPAKQQATKSQMMSRSRLFSSPHSPLKATFLSEENESVIDLT